MFYRPDALPVTQPSVRAYYYNSYFLLSKLDTTSLAENFRNDNENSRKSHVNQQQQLLHYKNRVYYDKI